MSKIIFYAAVSADGFIAREDGGVEWLDAFNSIDYGYEEFVTGIGAVLMGYNTFEKSLEFGPEVFKGRMHFVATHRDSPEPPNEMVRFIHGDPDELKALVEDQSEGPIWLMGGGDLFGQFFNRGLVDELWLFYMPIILGRGIPLFGGHEAIAGTFNISELRSWKNGVVLHQYALSMDQ